jgi:protein transport protein SEC31
MKICKIDKTSTVAWSPNQEPLLALGTMAGALDVSFSAQTELEIYKIQKRPERVAVIQANSRFNRLSWSKLLAAGKENGELDLYNTDALLQGQEALVHRNSKIHSGPVTGLHFNPIDTHLLASGASDGELFIWDLNALTKPYAPGARSQRLEDITVLSWNRQFPHILACGSNNGYSIVWDLRHRKEILKLPYPGGRRPITSIAWNPDAVFCFLLSQHKWQLRQTMIKIP